MKAVVGGVSHRKGSINNKVTTGRDRKIIISRPHVLRLRRFFRLRLAMCFPLLSGSQSAMQNLHDISPL
jgi:hypothetical protein